MEKTNFGARQSCPKTGRGHIFVLDPQRRDSENYVYHISTPWKMTYPRKLAYQLEWHGFEVLDWSNGVGCDVWDPLFTVSAEGVYRGSVELNWPENGAAPIQQTRPWVLRDWHDIDTILRNVYPTLEITLTVIGSLLAGALFFTALFYTYKFACKRFGWNDRTADYWKWRSKQTRAGQAFEDDMAAACRESVARQKGQRPEV